MNLNTEFFNKFTNFSEFFSSEINRVIMEADQKIRPLLKQIFSFDLNTSHKPTENKKLKENTKIQYYRELLIK
jgi:hypothetical protein